MNRCAAALDFCVCLFLHAYDFGTYDSRVAQQLESGTEERKRQLYLPQITLYSFKLVLYLLLQSRTFHLQEESLQGCSVVEYGVVSVWLRKRQHGDQAGLVVHVFV